MLAKLAAVDRMTVSRWHLTALRSSPNQRASVASRRGTVGERHASTQAKKIRPTASARGKASSKHGGQIFPSRSNSPGPKGTTGRISQSNIATPRPARALVPQVNICSISSKRQKRKVGQGHGFPVLRAVVEAENARSPVTQSKRALSLVSLLIVAQVQAANLVSTSAAACGLGASLDGLIPQQRVSQS
jgi:hypothetical protein